ncbi:ABC transporter permease [Pseudahrensia aquimaris]|uniref:ABC transporter permease n=1 Tax=Pseudahrensia aquimaris TaxID=744461 RepID=A0ABW3FBB0_9HYPH
MFESLQLLWIEPPGRGLSLLQGLLSTLQIALGAYALGLTIGLLGALGKIHGNVVLRWALEFYTTIIRAVPELVLILLLYYAGSTALNSVLVSLGFETVDISGLVAGIAVLGLVMGAYSTEVIRAAMLAVPKGQTEAALAFGMSRFQVLRRVTIPAMIPFALPGLSNLWLIVTKDTALLAVVGFFELATVTKAAAGSTRNYLLFYCAAAVLYLCVTLISNMVFRRIEKHYRVEKSADASTPAIVGVPR